VKCKAGAYADDVHVLWGGDKISVRRVFEQYYYFILHKVLWTEIKHQNSQRTKNMWTMVFQRNWGGI
jgi:hypothetical protein